MTFWVVYFSPSDFPGKYVLRTQVVLSDGTIAFSSLARSADSLAEIRAHIPRGLCRLERHPKDAPAIIECWL